MRIFKTKQFARKQRIGDAMLRDAVERADAGHIDADLGGGVIKPRIARMGQGRGGGYRVLVFYRGAVRSVFVFGFAKNDQGNIDDDELQAFRKAAGQALAFSAATVEDLLATDKWQEIVDDDTPP